MHDEKENIKAQELGWGENTKRERYRREAPKIDKVDSGDCRRKCEVGGRRKGLGFRLYRPPGPPPHFYRAPSSPTVRPTPLPSLHKRPHQLHAGSCSPHPGSGAWGCSTGPDYRCSGSCPPDGSRGHSGNPPGLHPELGGPHPSGKPSHFPGSSKTWSRFGHSGWVCSCLSRSRWPGTCAPWAPPPRAPPGTHIQSHSPQAGS